MKRTIETSAQEQEKVGRAYSFFLHYGPRSDIVRDIPAARGLMQIPDELELTVMGDDVDDGLVNDSELKERIAHDPALGEITLKAVEAGMNYAIEARYKGASHRKAAMELEDAMHGIYMGLYPEGADINGDIVYPRGNEYVFHRGN